VGQRVADRLAKALGKRWRREGAHQVARAEWQGEPLFLIKPHAFMNVTGPAVAPLLSRFGLDPPDLILIYDDIDLPLGKVRVRMRGGHGGHNGVRSLIEALGTTRLRRVKVGIGRPEDKTQVSDHVLSRFTDDELRPIEAGCAEAADRVLELVANRTSR
jgi:PTH1 family peptidyl-tRNA hydrolase